jgi:hypothetical protein
MRRRVKFNPKRRIGREFKADDLQQLAASVRYGGNPEHKRNPGDYGLTPPALPRTDSTLCDLAGVFERRSALRLLQEGIRSGMISEQFRGVFPQNVWAVTESGCPLEAHLVERPI